MSSRRKVKYWSKRTRMIPCCKQACLEKACNRFDIIDLQISVARLGGQRALGCGGAIIVQLPNLMWHRVWTAGNHSMGGRLILLPPQGWLIVRSSYLQAPWFWKAHESERYVECATDTTGEYPESHVRQLNRPRGRGLAPSRAQDSLAALTRPVWLPLLGHFPYPRNSHFKLRLLSKMHYDFLFCGRTGFRKGSLMLEGASPLSDRSASSRKSEEVITDEPHAGKLARVVLAGLSPRSGMAVSGHPPLFTVREALFNTLRKDVHRGQNDSVIGMTTTYVLVNENHLDRIRVNNNVESGRPLP
ncbi:neuralized-like protein 4 [Striga asiatica]|uniref:Neuralized-like protein 4 n=1 Tax=Striga asiatica TaxID=4170 RepID=A0A5A7QRT1_STRAF|nr:neuralized-like protein 4 [Striga asiatica]